MSNKLLAIIDMARFAREQHEGQVRKTNGLPYITHLAEVAGYTSTVTDKPEALMAAWGHDLMEDCQVGAGTLIARFGMDVAKAIQQLSDIWDKGSNRQERHQSSLHRLQEAPDWVQTVKCADIISNVSTLHNVTASEAWRKIYLLEKFEQLDAMKKGNFELKRYAYDVATACQEKIGG